MAWPDVATDLLAGPRGRRLCYQVLKPHLQTGTVTSPGWSALYFTHAGGAAPRQLAAELASSLATADLAGVAAATDELALWPLVEESVGYAMYWQAPDDLDQALANPEVAAALKPVAEALTTAPAARWWSSPVDPDRQVYIQFLQTQGADHASQQPPVLSGAAANLARWLAGVRDDESEAAKRPPDPEAPYSGQWWSAPITAATLLSTTRSLPGLGAAGLTAYEDPFGWVSARCWPLRPSAGAGIYEVSSPDDWTALVARYPLDVSASKRHDWWRVTGRAGRWLIPDFAAVAEDYDAVHVTVGGYLTTAGRVLPADRLGRSDGAAAGVASTMLAGWSPDETYWLADVVNPAGLTSRWVLVPDSAPLSWQEAPPEGGSASD